MKNEIFQLSFLLYSELCRRIDVSLILSVAMQWALNCQKSPQLLL